MTAIEAENLNMQPARSMPTPAQCAPSARFWDRIAEKYARSPIADEASYQTKLRMTQEYLRPDMDVLEIGCGTGSTALVHAPHVHHIDAIDVSSKMLSIAQAKADAGGITNVSFRQSAIEDLAPADQSYDAVLALSVLHLLDDKEALVSEVSRVLVPGGFFAFNTSFYSGTYAPGTERLYVQWVQRALEDLTERARQEGIRRKKGKGRRAFSQPWLSSDEYRQLLERAGFTVREVCERSVELTRHSFETIGAYSGCASVVLSGWPVDLASAALQRAAGPTFDEAGVDTVPRRWLEMIAFKG